MEENRDITDKIEALETHFYNYLFTKTVRDISLSANIKDKYWDIIKSMESQRSGIWGRRTYKVEEIYQLMIPFVEFLKGVNNDVLPNLRRIIDLNTPRLSLSPQEKSVRNILVDNYRENIYRLGKIVLDLYELTVNEDMKINKNKIPLCMSIKEIKNLERDLEFIEDYRQ